MSLSIEFFVRIFGAIVGTIILALTGRAIATYLQVSSDAYSVIFGLIGFLAGLVLTPALTIRPIRQLRNRLINLPPERLGAILLGIFLGLIAAALVTVPLSALPAPFGQYAPIMVALLFCYFLVIILSLRQDEVIEFFQNLRPVTPAFATSTDNEMPSDCILLDTSVIIDGRITDISRTGFLRANLIVPNFVLMELQYIADSADALRRNRGRRGLEVLRILQQDSPVPVEFTDKDVSEVREVDSKLVALARDLRCPVMTNDYNLNRVAELQGVNVLNINDLANAVKSAFLPGEELTVKVIQEGKEAGQGVGYLDDGTMVVVEDGNILLNRNVNVTVTKVLQTTAGRMIFARP